MESTLSAATLFSISKTLNSKRCLILPLIHSHFRAPTRRYCIIRSQLANLQLRRLFNTEFTAHHAFASIHHSSNSIRSLSPIGCLANSAASFSSGSGGGGEGIGGTGGGGGGDGGAEDGNVGSKSAAGGTEEVSGLSPDVIILDVTGMTCGGCAASVKRILESQPKVSAASVNLATETAVVWPVSEAKVVPNWKKHLGETLAKHLTSCGFNSNPRGPEAIEEQLPS